MPNHIFQLPDASQQPLLTLPTTGCNGPQIAQRFGNSGLYFGAEAVRRSSGNLGLLVIAGLGYLAYKAAKKYGPTVISWYQQHQKSKKVTTFYTDKYTEDESIGW